MVYYNTIYTGTFIQHCFKFFPFWQFANHIKKSEVGVKGSKLKKVEIKISIDNIKVEDIKTKVLFLTSTCLFIVLITTIDVKFASSFACFTAVSG